MRRPLRPLVLPAIAAAGLACATVETGTPALPPRPSGAYTEAPRATMPSSLPNQVTIPDRSALPQGGFERPSLPQGSLPDRPSLPGQASLPDRPALPQKPGLPDRPALPDRPSMPEKPSLPDRASLPKLTDRSMLPEEASQRIIPFRVPPDRVPPRGLCAIWYDGLPPERQPPSMTCARAHRIARSHGGRVIWATRELAFSDGEVASAPYARVDLHGIPPDRLPPPGTCRVWLDGVPPDRQPPPTRCPEAEREAQRTGGRLVYMPSSDVQ